MVATSDTKGVAGVSFSQRPVNRLSAILSPVLGNSLGAIGATLIVLVIALAIAAPIVSPFDPVDQPAKRLLAPSTIYRLGTDEFGRDIFSRIVFGSRVSLEVGIISVGIALLLGGTA